MGSRDGAAVKERALTIGEIVLRSADYLADKGVDTPRLDAELLVAHVLSMTRLSMYMEWNKPLMELEIGGCREAIRRRGQEREPVARITGSRGFYSRDFEVAPGVFCPRPETEGLVELALEFLRLHVPEDVARPNIFEPCTGTGCISITLALEHERARVVASDISDAALALAERNAKALHATSRTTFRKGDLFAGWEGPLHLVVSNPPYIRTEEIRTLAPEVRSFDPHAALDGGADGLDAVRRIVDESARLLVPGGGLFMEIGQEQGRSSRAVLEKSGAFDHIDVKQDLAGLDRYVLARRKAG